MRNWIRSVWDRCAFGEVFYLRLKRNNDYNPDLIHDYVSKQQRNKITEIVCKEANIILDFEIYAN